MREEDVIKNKLFRGETLTNEEGLFLVQLLLDTRRIAKTLIGY